MKTTINKQNGFTLIELMVVLSILALLASVIFGWVNGARVSAESTKAEVQVDQMETALFLATDAGGSVPSSPGDYRASGVDEIVDNMAGGVLPDLSPRISKVPYYYYISNGQRSVDAVGNEYFCVSANDVIPDDVNGDGQSNDPAIVTWRDYGFDASDDSRERLVLVNSPGGQVAFGGSFYLSAFFDQFVSYGNAMFIVDRSVDNQEEPRWIDEDNNARPFACSSLR